jgi:hypothetical protein
LEDILHCHDWNWVLILGDAADFIPGLGGQMVLPEIIHIAVGILAVSATKDDDLFICPIKGHAASTSSFGLSRYSCTGLTKTLFAFGFCEVLDCMVDLARYEGPSQRCGIKMPELVAPLVHLAQNSTKYIYRVGLSSSRRQGGSHPVIVSRHGHVGNGQLLEVKGSSVSFGRQEEHAVADIHIVDVASEHVDFHVEIITELDYCVGLDLVYGLGCRRGISIYRLTG